MAIYCPNCGKKLPDDAGFCDNCGTKIPERKAQNKPVPKEETGKKKSSGLMTFLKWFVILNVVGGIGIALIGVLESVFHRTPPADPPSQQTPASQNSNAVSTIPEIPHRHRLRQKHRHRSPLQRLLYRRIFRRD